MTDGPLNYYVVYKRLGPRKPTSLIASWVEIDQPLRAVLWSRPDRKWVYAPAIAAGRLYDDRYQDTVEPVDRAEAENVATHHLGTTLPDEATLLRMCQEGQELGQEWGPPLS